MTKPKLVTITDHENNILAAANAWRDAREALDEATDVFYEAMQGGRDAGMSLAEIGDLAELNKGSVHQMLTRHRLKKSSE